MHLPRVKLSCVNMALECPRCGLFDQPVGACHIQYTFLSLCQFCSKDENTRSLPFSCDTKMATDGKALILRASLTNRVYFSNAMTCHSVNYNVSHLTQQTVWQM